MSMKGLFTSPAFPSFGPTRFVPDAGEPAVHLVAGPRTAALRVEVRQQCPRRPGVYGMLTERGELIYIGKAKCLRTRLLGYFRPKGRDPKAGHIIRQARAIVWEHAPNEFGALLRELELIRRWRPRYNVQGQPGRRRPVYLCLGRAPAPYAFVTREPPRGLIACHGPLSSGWRVREAARYLNDLFQLRDCPSHQEMVFADQLELFPVDRAAGCLRHEIGACLGPCVGACTRRGYSKHIRAVKAFLAGEENSCLGGLQARMEAAALAQAFEQAAALRDRLETLRWLYDSLNRLRHLRHKQSFVYSVGGAEGKDLWYLIHQGRVVTSLPRPKQGGSPEMAHLLKEIYGLGGTLPRWGSSDEMDSVLLVASWFQRYPEEKAHLLSPQEAVGFVASRAPLGAG